MRATFRRSLASSRTLFRPFARCRTRYSGAKFQWVMARAERRACRSIYHNSTGFAGIGVAYSSISLPRWTDPSVSTRSKTANRTGAGRTSKPMCDAWVCRGRATKAACSTRPIKPSVKMAARYPFIEPLRELRYSLAKLKLNDLQVGSDARNRAVLGAYGTKTGRNAPSNSKFVFGPAKWIRFLITPPVGLTLIHRDYCQQEVRIAAARRVIPRYWRHAIR